MTSADIRETDFLGGSAGRLSSLAGGGMTLESCPVSAPFNVGLETTMLLRLGGRAGDISPLKQMKKEIVNEQATPLILFTVSYYQDEKTVLIKEKTTTTSWR